MDLDKRYKALNREYAKVVAAQKEKRLQGAIIQWERVVPQKFKKAQLADWTHNLEVSRTLKKVINAYKNNKPNSIAIYGVSGVGKTYVVWTVLHEIVKVGLATISDCARVTEAQLANITINSPERDGRLRRLLSSKILFVEDVGKAPNFGFGSSDSDNNRIWVWSEIINNRYDQNKTLFITTSLNPAQLKERIGLDSYDKLIAISAIDKVLLVEGNNMRVKVKRKE